MDKGKEFRVLRIQILIHLIPRIRLRHHAHPVQIRMILNQQRLIHHKLRKRHIQEPKVTRPTPVRLVHIVVIDIASTDVQDHHQLQQTRLKTHRLQTQIHLKSEGNVIYRKRQLTGNDQNPNRMKIFHDQGNEKHLNHTVDHRKHLKREGKCQRIGIVHRMIRKERKTEQSSAKGNGGMTIHRVRRQPQTFDKRFLNILALNQHLLEIFSLSNVVSIEVDLFHLTNFLSGRKSFSKKPFYQCATVY